MSFNTRRFRLGQMVEWESAAAGSRTRKVGKVVLVVPARVAPEFAWRHSDLGMDEWRSSRNKFGGGAPRDHETYVVRVERGGRALPKYYWPNARKLTGHIVPVAA